MNRVVYNSCFGGFSLSKQALEMLFNLNSEAVEKTETGYRLCREKLVRHDPKLIKVIETLGENANGRHSNLQIAIIAGSEYRITEYDGAEGVEIPDDLEFIKIDF